MELIKKIQKFLEEIRGLGAEESPIPITRHGRRFEQSFLGFTLPDDVDLSFSEEEYVSFSEALEEAKGIQPEGYDPSNPSEGCNKRFFEAVRSFLRMSKDDLRLFISVGTRLDFWHGADAVFCWRGVWATVDVTVDPKKRFKADFCVSPAMVESGEVYSSIAREIALLLVHRTRVAHKA